MPSTHLALNYHVVFSTKNREPWLSAEIRPLLHEYLGGTLRGLGGAPLAAGGVSDHVHVFFGLSSTHRLADVMRELKSESSKWLRQTFKLSAFAWQEGYGAFTVGPGELERVRSYVLGQEEHHRTRSFQEEYLAMLERAAVKYDEQYLW